MAKDFTEFRASVQFSCSVVSDSATPWMVTYQAPQSMGFSALAQLHGVGCHFLLQGIFPTQGSNPGLLHGRQMLYRKLKI